MRRVIISGALLLSLAGVMAASPASASPRAAKVSSPASVARCSNAAIRHAAVTHDEIVACKRSPSLSGGTCPTASGVLLVDVRAVTYALRAGRKPMSLGRHPNAGSLSRACGHPTASVPIATTSPTVETPVTPAIRVGPGPLPTYAVQAQPAPGSCHYTYVGPLPLPDPRCTPGATNPAVTQADLGTTICRAGYTSAIRPPESVTAPEKIGSARAYGYSGPLHTAEYDHLISLELGGDPNDAANLWVEPNDNPNATSTANSKDVLENRLHELLCSGQIPLAAAQDAIATNWVTTSQRYGGPFSVPTTVPVAPPPPSVPTTTPPSPAPAACHPLTNGGRCYEAGEDCRNSDHGVSGVAGDGESITCEDRNGWRWEPA